MKTIWSTTVGRVWLIVSASFIVLILAVNIVATQWGLVYETINLTFGGQRFKMSGDISKYQYYQSDYDSKAKTFEAANALNERIVGEGVVLLKNEGGALPLKIDERRVSVFGKNSVDMIYGGSGSSKREAAQAVSIYDSLTNARFTYNPTLKTFYGNKSLRGDTPSMGSILTGFPIGETPRASYASVRSSYSEYSDAALVMFSRIGGEGYDLPRTMKQTLGGAYDSDTGWTSVTTITGARSINDHYLQLDQNETDLLAEVCENFNKVIVLLNSGTQMELGFLDSPSYWASLGMNDYSSKIQAALWIGNPGEKGMNAIGKILTGEINPSGRFPDTYARNFKDDPTWNNFSSNLAKDGDRYFSGGSAQDAYFVRYEEGIYVGYRYYETRGLTDGKQWYDNNVVYPLGHGLSYTKFDWEIVANGTTPTGQLSKEDTITVNVKVKNTGVETGKDVVQLYYTAPFDNAKDPGKQIEKAHVILGDFAKTGELKPGDEEIVTLTIKLSDMASYDFNDANGNGLKGYELDGGVYIIRIGKNAHDAWDAENALRTTYSVPGGGYQYSTDSVTGYAVVNRFNSVSNSFLNESTGEYQLLSRNGWEETWPKTPQERGYGNVDSAFMSPFLNHTISSSYDRNKPWFKDTKPEQPKKELSVKDASVKLYDLRDRPYNDDLWEDLIDQLTPNQMAALIGQGAYKTNSILNVSKPETLDYDGPAGFAAYMSASSDKNVCFYASETLVAATWNKELAYAMGKMIGNESIWGMTKSNTQRSYSGWYAPAVNIHRSQFSGRNFEYYSEDGTLSGKMAAEICKGAQAKGTYTFVKHFALNDQETHRDANGISTWASEQSMREIYFKPFELAVKEGKTAAMMSSFNRIGTTWAGCSYELLTEVLRNEWGFKGMVITDFNTPSYKYMNADKMIRAGGDLNLAQDMKPSSNTSALTATQLYAMRKAAKNILFTVANSNAMNGIGKGVGIKTIIPLWVEIMIYVDCAIIIGLGVWGFLVIRKAYRKQKIQK